MKTLKRTIAQKNGLSNNIIARYKTIRNGAIKRKIEISLTINEYLDLFINKPFMCDYCGVPLKTYRPRGEEHPKDNFSIDRKYNNWGYSKNNIVLCCNLCNIAKQDYFNYSEMKKLGQIIREIRKERGEL